MNYVLDTNVISELIARKPNPKVVAWLDSLDPATLCLTVITIGEIRKGVEKLPASKRKDDVRNWLETDLLLRFQGKILDITTDVMLVWGELTGRLENEGKPLSAIDSLIAAIVLRQNYSLVTRNDSHFQHTGVKIINPWTEV
ncbi:MAG: type II toxin-antitoxin system VapC family toxin [Roseiflexaceae bacterium]